MLGKDDIIFVLSKYARKLCFQLEAGELNGALHYQGRMTPIKKKRKPELLKLMGDDKFDGFEPTVSAEHKNGLLSNEGRHPDWWSMG